MAPPTKKEKGRPRKGPQYSHRQHRKRANIPRRLQANQPINIREMIYRLLDVDEHNQERKAGRASKEDRYHGKIRKYRNARELSYDSSPHRDSSVSVDESEYTKSAATSADDLSRVMDAANSSPASSSGNSSVSNISVEPIALAKTIDNTRALLKKKSLVQIINNYIKAGIEEGKRRAKKYIRKALSFGVKSGYLIPTDPQGQVIRVCPTLIESKRSDIEERRRRRRARKGEDNPLIPDKEHKRPTPPWNILQKPHRELTPKPEAPPKKKRKTSDSKDVDTNKTKRNPRKKTTGRGRQGSSKRKTSRRRRKMSSTSSDKSDEDAKKTKKKRASLKHEVLEGMAKHRVRRDRSPHARKEGKENYRRSRRERSDDEDGNGRFSENEEKERTSVGRGKSPTNQEDGSRNCNEPPEHPAEAGEEILGNQNDENNNTKNLD